MTTTFLYTLRAIFIGISEILNESAGPKMEEALMSLIVFWNMNAKTVVYKMETDAFSNVINIISRKISSWSISHSYNLIKELRL